MSLKALQLVAALVLTSLAALLTVLVMALAANSEPPWQPLAQVELDSRTQGVAVDNDLALVASGRAGVYTLDLTDPAAPSLLGGYDTPDDALGVDMAGNLGVVADYRSGLLILDLTDPTQPRLLSTLSLEAPARAVVLQGTYGYLAAGEAGLVVVDLSDPEQPQAAANLTFTDPALNLHLEGSRALVALGAGGVAVVDLADPLNPLLRALWADNNQTLAVTQARGYGYLAQGQAGLAVLDLADADRPQLVGRLPVTDELRGLASAGNYLYLALNRDGLGLARTDDPAHPLWLAGFDSPGYGLAVAASQDTVLLADGPEGLALVRALPMASITRIEPNPAVLGEPVEVLGTGLGYTMVNAYRWESDLDGRLGNMPWLRLSNLSLGRHNLTLRVADTSGHWSLPAQVEFVVTLRPTATILTPATTFIHENQTLTVSGQGEDDGFLAAYEWQLVGQGPVCWQPTCGLEGLPPGDHSLLFRVQDDQGFWSTPATLQIQVNGLPRAQLLGVQTTLSGGLAPTGEPVTLRAAGTDDGPPEQLTFSWFSNLQGYLGSGAELTLDNLMPGYHRLSLQVSDELGGLSPLVTTSLVVADRPQAAVNTRPPPVVGLGDRLEFSGTGTPSQQVLGYAWESDLAGTLSLLPEFATDNLPAGLHNITFTAYSAEGVPSLPQTFTLLVNAPPTAQIVSVEPNPALEGEPLTLRGAGSDGQGPVVSHRWSLAQGQVLGLEANLTVTLTPGRYQITYRVEDQQGSWSDPAQVEVVVVSRLSDRVIHVAPGPAAFEDGSVDYPLTDLGQALAAAQPGWIVQVHGGEYRGAWVVAKPLTLIGLGNATLMALPDQAALTLLDPGVNLTGFTFRGEAGSTGVAANIEVGALRNLRFEGLKVGLFTTNGLPTTAENISFVDNDIGWLMERVAGNLSASGLHFAGNGVGLKISDSASADLQIRQSYFVGNRDWAVNSQSLVDARSNYWGHPTGPREAVLNPEGLGDAVSAGVAFIPWLTKETRPPVIVSEIEYEVLKDGGLRFTWQTDRPLLTSLVVTYDDDQVKKYPGNSTPSRYHEAVVYDIQPGRFYQVKVVAADEADTPVTSTPQTILASSSRVGSNPFGFKEIMYGVLLLGAVGATSASRIRSSRNEDIGLVGVLPEGQETMGLPRAPTGRVDQAPAGGPPATKGGPGYTLPDTLEVGLLDPPPEAKATPPEGRKKTLTMPHPESLQKLRSQLKGSAALAATNKSKADRTDEKPVKAGSEAPISFRMEQGPNLSLDTSLPSKEEKVPRWVEPEVDWHTGRSDYQKEQDSPAKPSLGTRLKERARKGKGKETTMAPLEAYGPPPPLEPTPYTALDYPPLDGEASAKLVGLGLSLGSGGHRLTLGGEATAPPENDNEDGRGGHQPGQPGRAAAAAASTGFTLEETQVAMSDMLEGIEQMGVDVSDLRWQSPLGRLEEKPSLALELKRAQEQADLPEEEQADDPQDPEAAKAAKAAKPTADKAAKPDADKSSKEADGQQQTEVKAKAELGSEKQPSEAGAAKPSSQAEANPVEGSAAVPAAAAAAAAATAKGSDKPKPRKQAPRKQTPRKGSAYFAEDSAPV